jgi:glycosyltransferase involved in cell wall biosynthesis
MNSEPRISIAMATYNGARFIREQLDSLARQTLLPCELVVSDDGSTDATLEIVQDFAREVPFPVRSYRNPARLGYADNFLKAAGLCEGEFVAFCDQDDVWLPSKLAAHAHQFLNSEILLCFCNAHVVDSSLNPLGREVHFFSKDRVYAPVCFPPFKAVYGFTIAFRKEALVILKQHPRCHEFLSHPENPKPASHDNWIVFLAGSFGHISEISAPHALYRQHLANSGGAPQRRNVVQQLRLSFSQGQSGYDFLSRIAGQRARILEKVEATIPPEFRPNCRKAIHYYQHLSATLELRSSIYSPDAHFLRRICALMGLLKMRGYRSTHFHMLGERALLKDITFSMLPHFLMVQIGGRNHHRYLS